MENGVGAPGRAKIAFRHLRTDKWWVEPLISVVVLLSFIAYSTWRAFENDFYYVDHLVSPFYSPCLATSCPPEAAILGTPFGDWWTLVACTINFGFPTWLPLNLLLLPQDLLPRILDVTTCLFSS